MFLLYYTCLKILSIPTYFTSLRNKRVYEYKLSIIETLLKYLSAVKTFKTVINIYTVRFVIFFCLTVLTTIR